MEKDNEGLGGGGSTYDYGFRIYNPQLGKFLSVDPLTSEFPMITPYQFAENMPIWAIDLDGLESAKSTIKHVIRIYDASITGDAHTPVPDGTTVPFSAGQGAELFTAGTTMIQQGDPEGNVEIRYTDVVPGGNITTYWVIEKPAPIIVKADESTSSRAAQVPEPPKTPPLPVSTPSVEKKASLKKVEPPKDNSPAIVRAIHTESQWEKKQIIGASIWNYSNFKSKGGSERLFSGSVQSTLNKIAKDGGKIMSFTINVYGGGNWLLDGNIKATILKKFPNTKVNFNYNQPSQGGTLEDGSKAEFGIDIQYETKVKK
jgi:RHS repeat-associated protein